MADLTIKEAIEKVMKDNGLENPQQVAEHAKSSPHTVAKILDGSDRLQFKNVKELFNNLGYDLNVLVTPKSDRETALAK